MDLIQTFFSTLGTWFGFVGSCVAGPDVVCRPFIGFVMLTTMAAVALYLVLKAYQAAQSAARRSDALRRTKQRQLQVWIRSNLNTEADSRAVSSGGWRLPA
jgi:7-keto-8-aminopelargonate synthetase-like enzyme